MSRKFNMGRQNDMLLNDKMHDLYSHLEFITYKDGDGNTITMPRQSKQTAIPKGALWLQHPMNTDTHKLRVHTNPEANDMEEKWPCLFEGYYHPASLTEMPKKPVHGQIWIDDKNTLRVYDDSGVEGQWKLVLTGLLTEEKYDVFNGMDFQLIDPLLPLSMGGDYEGDPIYSIPHEGFGKYYTAKKHDDEYVYCHPPVNADLKVTPYYDKQQNPGAISITDDGSAAYEAKAWVHINPYNLDKVTKRLIKITKPATYYRSAESKLKLPQFFFEDEANQGKSLTDYINECMVEKTNEEGRLIKVIYVDNQDRIVDLKKLYESGIIEMPEDENLDSGMEVEPLDPNPIPGDDFDSGMNNDEYKEIPDNSYDEGMNVEPLDPNPTPGDDFDSGMDVEPLDPNPIPDDDFDSDMNVEWQLPEVKEIVILEVVSNEMELEDFEPSYMIKQKLANSKKYTQSLDFAVGNYVIETIVTDQNTGFIAVPAGSTEYFAFKSGQLNGYDEYDNKIGRLLKRYTLNEGIIDTSVNEDEVLLDYRNDYEIRNGGIVLDPDIVEEYDYIYAVTYSFKSSHSIDGKLIRITRTSLEGPDQMYIGSCNGIPVVFMDGLYLEHYDDKGTVYTYENENIVFSGDNVLDNMQIMVVSFPYVNTIVDDYGVESPVEYEISSKFLRERFEVYEEPVKGAIQVVDIPIDETTISYNDVIAAAPNLKDVIDDSGKYYVLRTGTQDVVIQGKATESLFDKDKFPNPLIFYNGLAGYTYAAFISDNPEDKADVHIDYENRTLTLYDFGPIIDSNGKSSIFAVSLGANNPMYYGVLEDGVLYNENIHADTPYLVIVDGIVMSPYNEDVTVEEGKITITDATVALDSECSIVQLTDPNDESILDDTDAVMCIYDDMFTPYTIPIVDPKAMNLSNAYDDCDSAVVMCGPGVLVDREALLRDYDPNDKFVGGQIIKKRLKTTTTEELYEWRMYTHTNEYVVLDPIENAALIGDCNNMVTYHVSDGTVMLNPVHIDDQPITVYAYTYTDSVDERLLRGQRLIPIDVPKHSDDKLNIYRTNRTHLYDVGVGALSTYINGVMVHHSEENTLDAKGDLFYINHQQSSSFIPFINRYREPELDNRFASQDMYNVLMAEGFTDDCTLDTEIEVINNGVKERCLVEKFFNSEHQLEQAKLLKKYILNDMKNNNLFYIIENVEHNEMASCRREWRAPRNDNGNLPNSYTTTMRMMPGIINVYVNGVLLEKDDYAIYDNNKVMIGFDLVGGQEILPKNKGDYKYPYRVLTDEGFKFIECENNDEVLIEVRDDLTVKKRTYRIKDVSYETHSFDIEDYEYPASLSSTKDVIKIYINGVLYDGDYTNIGGVITLLECDLEEDPLYKHLRMYPSAMEEYRSKYGEYIAHEDTITFEWR